MGKDLRPSPCVYCTFSGSRHGGSHKTSLRRERALCLFRQRGKAGRVVHGDVRQHLAVEGDAGLHQAVHEAAVADAVGAGRRVDAGDPQRTEIALLLLAADVGVLQRLRDRLLGDAEDLATGVVIALGLLENLLVRSEEHTSELQSLMRISYAVFCLKKKKQQNTIVSQDQYTKTPD